MELERHEQVGPAARPAPRAALEAGIGQMREWVRFWERLAK